MKNWRCFLAISISVCLTFHGAVLADEPSAKHCEWTPWVGGESEFVCLGDGLLKGIRFKYDTQLSAFMQSGYCCGTAPDFGIRFCKAERYCSALSPELDQICKTTSWPVNNPVVTQYGGITCTCLCH
jgi:hypothetical protein